MGIGRIFEVTEIGAYRNRLHWLTILQVLQINKVQEINQKEQRLCSKSLKPEKSPSLLVLCY